MKNSADIWHSNINKRMNASFAKPRVNKYDVSLIQKACDLIKVINTHSPQNSSDVIRVAMALGEAVTSSLWVCMCSCGLRGLSPIRHFEELKVLMHCQVSARWLIISHTFVQAVRHMTNQTWTIYHNSALKGLGKMDIVTFDILTNGKLFRGRYVSLGKNVLMSLFIWKCITILSSPVDNIWPIII